MPKRIIFIFIIILAAAVSLLALTACVPEEQPAPDDTSKYVVVNGGFETGNLDGWTVVRGNAFSAKAVSGAIKDTVGGSVSFNKDGNYFFGRYNEAYTGAMLSSAFEIGGTGYMTFKLGGGKEPALDYLSVIEAESGVELARFANQKFNPAANGADYRGANLVGYYADLTAYKGKTARILAVDESTAEWGFLTLDSVETYYPEAPDTAGLYKAVDIKPVFTDAAGTPTELFNGDFSSGTLEGWTVVGSPASFTDAHIGADHKLSNRPSETETGVLRSSAFKVGGKNILSFRMGGTKYPELTYMVIKKTRTNEEIFRTYSNRWKSSDEENTHLYYVDLSKYKGETLYLEIVDNSVGDWGLVVIEQIKTYYGELPEVIDEIAVNLNEKVLTSPQYAAMRNYINLIIDGIEDETERLTFQKTFYATIDGISNNKGNWDGVLSYNKDGSVYCTTGDIEAMWLRDSSAQVLQYLDFIKPDGDVRLLVKGLLKKQLELIRRDPYANAFYYDGRVFERKFELDSLCYPIWLANEYYERTKDISVFDIFFELTAKKIVDTLDAERSHSDANYRIEHPADRAAGPHEVNTASGLIWSGYRPSDDVSYYKFFIPGNMFAVSALEKIDKLLTAAGLDKNLAARARTMAAEVRAAIETYGVYNHPVYGKIYAFEVNGTTDNADSAEGKLLMDAANIPSLISAPWIGYTDTSIAIYKNTRAFVLSDDNPYYYEGRYASGIGDPHDTVGSSNNPHRDVPVPWHMSIAMQALTSDDPEEIKRCIKYMTDTTGGTYVMHEAFQADDPTQYSRDFFTWPCSLYAHAVLTKILNVKP